MEVSNTRRRPSALPTARCGCTGWKAQQRAASLPILISHMDCCSPSCHMATAPSAAAVQNRSCLQHMRPNHATRQVLGLQYDCNLMICAGRSQHVHDLAHLDRSILALLMHWPQGLGVSLLLQPYLQLLYRKDLQNFNTCPAPSRTSKPG